MNKYPLNSIERLTDFRELLMRGAGKFGNKAAFRERTQGGVREISYADFAENVRALAAALHARLAGGRISILGENSYAWVLSYFAVVTGGHTAVPLDKELSEEEMADELSRAKVDMLLYSPTYEEEARAASDASGRQLQLLAMDWKGELPALLEEGRSLLAMDSALWDGFSRPPEEVVSILFTSGTTGRSKAVMLSQNNLMANTKAACELVLFTPQDVLLSVLPLHHAYEDMCGLFGPLYHGATICFCPWIKDLPRCMELFSPTVMVLVPLFIERFLGKIWAAARERGLEGKLRAGIRLAGILDRLGIHVRHKLLAQPRAALGGRLSIVISGGAHLAAEHVKAMRELGVTVLQGYGVSECSPIVSAGRNHSVKDEACGWIAPCCEVKISQAGEILVRGENVMVGYLDDPKATQAAIRQGWLHTGDLGWVDEDGFLYVTGRIKDMIVLKNGKNILPGELEEKISALPLVGECVVTAAEDGASLLAAIYPDVEASAGMEPDGILRALEEGVQKLCESEVYYKKIAEVRLFARPFPRTTSGKIKRFEVEEELSRG